MVDRINQNTFDSRILHNEHYFHYHIDLICILDKSLVFASYKYVCRKYYNDNCFRYRTFLFHSTSLISLLHSCIQNTIFSTNIQIFTINIINCHTIKPSLKTMISLPKSSLETLYLSHFQDSVFRFLA